MTTQTFLLCMQNDNGYPTGKLYDYKNLAIGWGQFFRRILWMKYARFVVKLFQIQLTLSFRIMPLSTVGDIKPSENRWDIPPTS